MRTKEFFLRISIFLPVTIYLILLLLILLGVSANLLGARDSFYCDIYCKVAALSLTLGIAAVIFKHFRACCNQNVCIISYQTILLTNKLFVLSYGLIQKTPRLNLTLTRITYNKRENQNKLANHIKYRYYIKSTTLFNVL